MLMKLLWKIYAVFYAMSAIILIISDISNPELQLIDYVSWVVSLPTILAVVGWAWRKAVGWQAIWLVYVIIFFSFDIVYNLFFTNQSITLAELVIGGLLLLPSYVATLLYAINFPALRGSAAGLAATPMSNHTAQTASITAWNHTEDAVFTDDPQLTEVQQMQSTTSAHHDMATSLAKETQASYDQRIEAQQLGKWPWDRWYSHPVVGRDVEKGIADIIFLSFFGHSSADDNQFSKGARAIIRVLFTLGVVAALSLLGQYLMST